MRYKQTGKYTQTKESKQKQIFNKKTKKKTRHSLLNCRCILIQKENKMVRKVCFFVAENIKDKLNRAEGPPEKADRKQLLAR